MQSRLAYGIRQLAPGRDCLLQAVLVALLAVQWATQRPPAFAETNTWIGLVAGNWGEPTNWSLGEVPDAPFSFDPYLRVNIDQNAGQASSVLIHDAYAVDELRIDADDELTIEGLTSADASLRTGYLENSGTLNILEDGGNAFLSTTGIIQNTASGTINIAGASFGAAGPPSNFFWNEGAVQGYGTLGMSTIWNDGLFLASVPEQVLHLGPSFSDLSFINTGALRAAGGGTLRLFAWQNDPIQNFDQDLQGTIEAWGDSTVVIRSTDITGGRIQTSTEGGVEEGEIHFDIETSLRNVELDANASLIGTTRFIDSTISNTRLLDVGPQTLYAAGEFAVSGGGQINLDQDGTIQGIGSGSGPARLVNIDNTIGIVGDGIQPPTASIGSGMFVDNRGTIEADGAILLLNLDSSSADVSGTAWSNSGVLRAINSGVLSIAGDQELKLLNEGGVIELDETSRISLEAVTVVGGTIRAPSTPPVPFAFPGRFAGSTLLDSVRIEGYFTSDEYVEFAGTIENAGVVSLESLSLDGEVSLTGGGEVQVAELRDGGPLPNNRLVNVDNTIVIQRNLNLNNVQLINRGTIESNDPSTTHHLDLSADLLNTGILRATGGSLLDNRSTTIKNYELDEHGQAVPGTLFADAESELYVGTVIGGILDTAADGVVRVRGLNSIDEAEDIQIVGRVEMDDGVLAGNIRNDGQIFISGVTNSGFSAVLNGLGRVHLSGSGQLYLGNEALGASGSISIPENSILVNGPGHTITGGGTIYLTDNLFLNEGRIGGPDTSISIEPIATSVGVQGVYFLQRGELFTSGNGGITVGDFGRPLANWANDGLMESQDQSIISVIFSEQFTNRGTIRIGPEASMRLTGTGFDGTPLINAPGSSAEVDGTVTVVSASLENMYEATLSGGGIIDLQSNEPLTNHGTLSPGSPIGELSIRGHFVQTETGRLEIEIGGTEPDEFDSLSVLRSAELAGLLEVTFVDLGAGLFTPSLGDSFTILEASPTFGLFGSFDALDLPTLDPGLAWDVRHGSRDVVLDIIETSLADLDSDGDVDGHDFLLIQKTNPSLLATWQQDFGTAPPLAAASLAVPEPTSVGLLLLALTTRAFVRKMEAF